MGDNVEKQFAGKQRASVWTYLFLAVLLVIIAIVVNLAIKNPDLMSKVTHSFLGLPSWALAGVTLLVGALLYWLGLKVETDWPEFMGAFLIAGAIIWFELIIGWHRLEFGLIVVPYVIPLLVFVVLIMVAVRRSR